MNCLEIGGIFLYSITGLITIFVFCFWFKSFMDDFKEFRSLPRYEKKVWFRCKECEHKNYFKNSKTNRINSTNCNE